LSPEPEDSEREISGQVLDCLWGSATWGRGSGNLSLPEEGRAPFKRMKVMARKGQ